ncbi:MAG: 4-hydroxy-tetrahydrodipicolinate synthase [Candidatus Omnitrophica bacterium]|nr:4-hydroxy-tetrahydrodipicolinate synthase [Candidatus Omnitrophota bacterium]
MFKGVAVALITPFTDSGIDFKALEKLIDFHIKAQTECILLCGTTGESPTLSHAEHKELIKYSAQYLKSARAGGRFPLLMAGTGSNSTREAFELTQAAKEDGADLCLQVTPYYNKPTQTGLLRHFQTLAREVDIPQVIYNIQGRTAVNVNLETTLELAREPNIIGVKEASGNITQISETCRLTPGDFFVWSGDDALTLPILSVGGHGVISVSANIIPGDVRRMVHHYLEGDIAQALQEHQKMSALNTAMFIETNPIPVKTAVNLLSQSPDSGLPYCGPMRLPLCDMAPGNVDKLKKSLIEYGLLPS